MPVPVSLPELVEGKGKDEILKCLILTFLNAPMVELLHR